MNDAQLIAEIRRLAGAGEDRSSVLLAAIRGLIDDRTPVPPFTRLDVVRMLTVQAGYDFPGASVTDVQARFEEWLESERRTAKVEALQHAADDMPAPVPAQWLRERAKQMP